MKCVIIVLNILLSFQEIYCARILGVFLVDGYSHVTSFSPIINDLARRGHEITLITMEKYPIDEGNHIEQINFYDRFQEIKKSAPSMFQTYPPQKLSPSIVKEHGKILHDIVFNSTEVQALLYPPADAKKFDLLLLELPMLSRGPLIEHFKIPTICLCNMRIFGPQLYIMTGVANSGQPAKTFWQRLTAWTDHLKNYLMATTLKAIVEEEALRHFSFDKNNMPDFLMNFDLVFFPFVPGLQPAAPLPMNIIPIAPTHLNTSKRNLDKETKNYLDDSTQGLVYMSLGTNIKFGLMPLERQKQFLDAFKNVPFNFLMQCATCNSLAVPSNVRIAKWVDQKSVLEHKNTKLIITHGGFHTVAEAVSHAVPLIVFPHAYDQFDNAGYVDDNQIGMQFDVVNFHAAELQAGILRVIQDKQYKDRMLERQLALKTLHTNPFDKISYWVDYLLEHKHVKFLQSESHLLPFVQFFRLDIIFCHLLLIVGVAYVIKKCCRM